METLEGAFDLIFMDSNPEEYPLYFDMILERQLLAPKGIIVVDNGRNVL